MVIPIKARYNLESLAILKLLPESPYVHFNHAHLKLWMIELFYYFQTLSLDEDSGVPQGSILGPMMLFINSTTHCIQSISPSIRSIL